MPDAEFSNVHHGSFIMNDIDDYVNCFFNVFILFSLLSGLCHVEFDSI